MTNSQIAKILYEMADYYEMEGVPFKPRAYQKAAEAIESLDQQVVEIYAERGQAGFGKIPGVGSGIADHLVELAESGKLKKYEQFQKKFPVDLSELTAIAGIGPKTVLALYKKLRVRTLADLRRAAQAHQIRNLPGFGKTSEEKILNGLRFREAHAGRFILGLIYPVVEDLRKTLESSGYFQKLLVGGSFRRMQETVGDIDLLGVAKHPEQAMEFFVKLPGVREILEQGKTKSEIVLQDSLQVDLRIVPEASWGAALQYFTGDKSHNIKLRKIAVSKGLKLSEYGLFKGHKSVAGRTEEEVYRALGLDWMPPELRTDTGEIEAAAKHRLPQLLPYGSVRGDLQTQTNWTDGANTIEEMAKAARVLGREYICITDHTRSLYMTGGLDEAKLLRQGREIDKLNRKFRQQGSKFRILKGAEVNIMKDGSLDLPDRALKRLDVVGVSVHSHFNLPRAEMTKRIIKALGNSSVDIFFHPTARLIQRREPIDFDFAEVLLAAKKKRVALEIDAQPVRMDIHDTLIREAVGAGAKFTIDSDAHNISQLDFLRFGEGQARRGWATKKDVLNTLPVEKLLEHFRK